MNKVFKAIIIVAFLLGTAVAAFALHDIIPSETVSTLPAADADDLNEYIVRYEPYRAWSLWPGKGRLYEGTEGHGELMTTFVNDAALRSIRKKDGMRTGSIVVTENYTADKEFLGLTVMYKKEGFSPDAGNWFWVKYAPNGKATESGKAEACINCHGKVKDNDYIWTGKVK